MINPTAPRIVIIMGDPAGIGPEVIVKALSDNELRHLARFIVVSSADVFAHALKLLKIQGRWVNLHR